MDYPKKITTIQVAMILISTIVGVGVLPLPLFAARTADAGGPMITLLGTLLATIGLWAIVRLALRFPGKTFIEYSGDIVGKWPARLGNAVIILFFVMLTSLTAREFGEVVVTSVLRKTPVEVTVIIMLLLAVIASRNDLSVFAYIHQFYLPLMIFPGLLIVALSLKNADWLNLLPVWGNWREGTIPDMLVIAALFQGFFIITMVLPHVRNPKRVMKAALWGIGLSGGLYLLIVIAAVGVFGAQEVKNLLWPTLELAKTTSLPANILERIDAAFLAIWVTAVFTTLFSCYYFTIHSLSQLFGLKDHKVFSFFLLPFVFIVAMLPKNVVQMYQTVEIVGKWGLLVTIGYPVFLYFLARLRKKGRGLDGSNA